MEIQWELTQIWNDKYQYYYRALYGNNWLEEKVKDIRDRIQKYVDKRDNTIRELESKFGPG
jgi:hypothetical protein